ncbi:MAG: hypothetical protein ABIK92_09085 [Pseudomonadota bacterium]
MSENKLNINGKDILYLKKNNAHGEAIAHFARTKWFYKYLPANNKTLALTLNDNKVYEEYSDNLIPRAIGYSSQALSYFFRGTIEISLPESGVYALINDPNQGFFSKITLLAKNISPEGEDMTEGSIELVIKYKLAQNDPFKNTSYYPLATSQEFSYIVTTVSGGKNSIDRVPSELTFDLSSHPLPLWATDVYLQVVYKGKLGSEDNAVAVGFKDISEPTPIDIFNSMNRICLYDDIIKENRWYVAGSAEAIAVVDSNNNGIADTNEWDVYSHNLKNIFLTFFPTTVTPHYPNCSTEEDIYFEQIPAGEYKRMFILSDYDFCISSCAVNVENTNSYDLWVTYFPPYVDCQPGIKNQTELADPAICTANGLTPPCYIVNYPIFNTINGIDTWSGINFPNKPYPEDSQCPME